MALLAGRRGQRKGKIGRAAAALSLGMALVGGASEARAEGPVVGTAKGIIGTAMLGGEAVAIFQYHGGTPCEPGTQCTRAREAREGNHGPAPPNGEARNLAFAGACLCPVDSVGGVQQPRAGGG